MCRYDRRLLLLQINLQADVEAKSFCFLILYTNSRPFWISFSPIQSFQNTNFSRHYWKNERKTFQIKCHSVESFHFVQ